MTTTNHHPNVVNVSNQTLKTLNLLPTCYPSCCKHQNHIICFNIIYWKRSNTHVFFTNNKWIEWKMRNINCIHVYYLLVLLLLLLTFIKLSLVWFKVAARRSQKRRSRNWSGCRQWRSRYRSRSWQCLWWQRSAS